MKIIAFDGNSNQLLVHCHLSLTHQFVGIIELWWLDSKCSIFFSWFEGSENIRLNVMDNYLFRMFVAENRQTDEKPDTFISFHHSEVNTVFSSVRCAKLNFIHMKLKKEFLCFYWCHHKCKKRSTHNKRQTNIRSDVVKMHLMGFNIERKSIKTTPEI